MNCILATDTFITHVMLCIGTGIRIKLEHICWYILIYQSYFPLFHLSIVSTGKNRTKGSNFNRSDCCWYHLPLSLILCSV